MRYLLVTLLLTLSGCAVQPQPFSVVIDPLSPSSIRYSGEINPENVTLFEKLIANAPTRIDSLIINSGGGDVFAGIRFGGLVYQYKLKVVVDKVCASSCANYVVTASDDVIVKSGGLLGWHGGALQPFYQSLMLSEKQRSEVKLGAQQAEYITHWRKAEEDFFKLIKVNQTVTVLGMMPELVDKRDAPLFSYDQQTLKQLGLNITFEGEQATTSSSGDYIVQIFNLSPDVLDMLLIQHDKRLLNN